MGVGKKETMATAYEGKNWQLIVAGILLVVFGIVCLVFPGITLGSIAFMIGAGFVLSGVVNVVTYFRDKEALDLAGWILAYGVVDILIGLMFLIHPMVFAVVLPWVVGMFIIVFAVYEIIGSINARKAGFSLWGWMLFSGIVSLLFGAGFFIMPEMLAILIGLFALMRGVSLAVLGANAPKFV